VELRPAGKIRLGAVILYLVATAHGAAQVPSQAAQAGQPGAQPPLRPLAVTQLDERQQGSDLDSIRPLDITLSDPTPIVDLLLMLVRDTRISVVPDPDVTGTFQGDLKRVTLRQALEMILQPRGYDYSVQGNLIRVFKRRLETRRFDLNYVVTRRSGSRTLAASNSVTGSGVGMTPEASANSQGNSTQVSGVDAGDIFADLALGVQTLLSPEGKFNVDKKAAMLQATDYPDRLDQVQLYLDAVHNRASRQVQIQTKVIEVVLSEEYSAGINWNLVIRSAGNAVSVTQRLAPTPAGTVTVGLRINDFTGLLNALATQGKVNVMSSPTVNALNNEPAIMRVGTQDVFFKTTAQTDAFSGRIVQTTVEPQAITEGVVLSVTPQISGDGMINMSISPSLTERTGQATSRFGDTVPILSVRETDTLVRVHENETIVIAGLMEERVRREERKVPFMGDLPGVGRLFRGEVNNRRKTDLVILLTPTVMTPARVPESTTHELNRLSDAGGDPYP
jgi:MSHA biogenesis protein MshL